MPSGKVAVVVTAYNEAEAIGDVLSKMDKSYDVYVIDDGSSDDTAEIAREHGAKVLTHPINLGQGSAMITAVKALDGKKYDAVVKLDGDGQHNPSEISKLLEKMRETGADIIAGSRLLGSNYSGAPFMRDFSLKPLTTVINQLTGYQISDSMCGFRAYNGKSFNKIKHIFEGMDEPEYIASEMWIKFSKAGLKVENVPIKMLARKKGVSYKGIIFKYGLGIIVAITRSKLSTYKYKFN